MAGVGTFADRLFFEECKQWFRRKCSLIFALWLSNPLQGYQADCQKRLVCPPILLLSVAPFLCPSFLVVHL